MSSQRQVAGGRWQLTLSPCHLVTLSLHTLLLLIVLMAGCQREGGSWPRIEESGILRVGLDPTYPPFEMADDGELHGLDVDLARAVAAELGLKAQFVYFGYDGLYAALQTKQVDVLISALVVMPERTRDFAYSEPYFNAGQVLVSADPELDQLAELGHRRLAVELGAEGHVLATTWQRRLEGLDILTYHSPAEAITAVVAGDADAALVDNVSGRLNAGWASGLHIASDPITVEPYALVVRSEDVLLLEKLDAALAALKTSGQLEAIIDDWLSAGDG